MKKTFRLLALLLLLTSLVSDLSAQAIVQGNTVYYPETHTVSFDTKKYKTAVQIDELTFPINEDLFLRVYYPDDLMPGEQRPLVILIHGGGFVTGTYAAFFQQAEYLASLGYVAATIQYRLCKRGDCLIAAGLGYPCNIAWGNSLIPSGYVASVDARDAILWLQDHAEDYSIDPDQVVVGGHSAGGWTALHTAFMDQDEIQELCPGCGVGSDYLSEQIPEVSGIRAIFPMSGALLNADWIDPDESDIDVMVLHGTHDGVVHYGEEPVYPCCNTYQTPIDGACPITQRLALTGNNYYLLSGNGYGHDIFEPGYIEVNQEQLLWFLGQSLFSDQDFARHSVVTRSQALATCPAPFDPVDASALCDFPEDDLGIVLFESPSSTQSISNRETLKVWPNPSRGSVTLSLPKGNTTWQGAIYSLTGEQVFTISSFLGEVIDLDISGLPAGVYFAVLGNAEGGVLRTKLVKE
jgi:predicted esterase